MTTKQTTTQKVDFKQTKKYAKKVGAFLMRFRDVKEPILTAKFAPYFKKQIELVYTIGLIILGIYALAALFKLPSFSGMLGGLISVLVIFCVFRMLCEILAGHSIDKK